MFNGNRDVTEPENSAPPPAESTTGGADWQNHEHVAELTHSHAQQLIESAGSAELAKHAIEVVDQLSAEMPMSDAGPRPEAQAKLARSLGYASYLDLFESSKPAATAGTPRWLVTAATDGSWALWNDFELQINGRFDSQQAALAAAEAPARKPK